MIKIFSKTVLPIFFLTFLASCLQAQDFDASFDHAALAVSNLEESGEFYSKILQLEEVEIPYENDDLRWFSLGGDLQLHLIRNPDIMKEQNKSVHLSLRVKNFQNLIRHLEKNLIEFFDWPGEKSKISLRPDGVQQVYIRDPDGHWIELNDIDSE